MPQKLALGRQAPKRAAPENDSRICRKNARFQFALGRGIEDKQGYS